MATVKFLGTCSGTEPFENMHHCSLIITVNGKNYWFDAGENCSFTAHMMGLDLQQVRAVFISHPHMDHIGGLGNLIDRIWLGFVTDMFDCRFIDFPVFNIADIAICVGCFFLVVFIFFFDKPQQGEKADEQ